jgi:hypothetical protein
MNQANQSRLLCYLTAQEHHLITSALGIPINNFSHNYRKSDLYALFTIVAAYASKTYNHLFKTEHEYVNMTVADKPLQITSMETPYYSSMSQRTKFQCKCMTSCMCLQNTILTTKGKLLSRLILLTRKTYITGCESMVKQAGSLTQGNQGCY